MLTQVVKNVKPATLGKSLFFLVWLFSLSGTGGKVARIMVLLPGCMVQVVSFAENPE